MVKSNSAVNATSVQQQPASTAFREIFKDSRTTCSNQGAKVRNGIKNFQVHLGCSRRAALSSSGGSVPLRRSLDRKTHMNPTIRHMSPQTLQFMFICTLLVLLQLRVVSCVQGAAPYYSIISNTASTKRKLFLTKNASSVPKKNGPRFFFCFFHLAGLFQFLLGS
jgi:hypothetical protein